MRGGLVEPADPRGRLKEGGLGAGVFDDGGCVLEPTIGVALFDELLHFREALGTASVTDTDSLQGTIETVERITGARSVGGISGSTQPAEQQHQRGCDRSSPIAQPANQRRARPSCDSGLGQVREMGRVGFCAKLGNESVDAVLSQGSVPGRAYHPSNRSGRSIRYGSIRTLPPARRRVLADFASVQRRRIDNTRRPGTRASSGTIRAVDRIEIGVADDYSGMTQIQQTLRPDTELISTEDVDSEAVQPSSQQGLRASLHSVPDRVQEEALKLWEYRAIFGGNSSSHAEKKINELGAEGWELVAVVPPADLAGEAVLYLKREKRS